MSGLWSHFRSPSVDGSSYLSKRVFQSKLLTWINYSNNKKCLGSTISKFAIFHTQRNQILGRGLNNEYRRVPELLSTSATIGTIFAAILRTTSHRTSIVTVTQPRAVSTRHHIVDQLLDTHINFHLCPHGQALTVFMCL